MKKPGKCLDDVVLTSVSCQSCEISQKVGEQRHKVKAPLNPLPIIEEAFYRVRIDIVGPLPKPTRKGCRYILTLIDFQTKYPEAEVLSSVDVESVAEALLKIF